MIDNVLNNMPPKKEPYLEYFATKCDELWSPLKKDGYIGIVGYLS